MKLLRHLLTIGLCCCVLLIDGCSKKEESFIPKKVFNQNKIVEGRGIEKVCIIGQDIKQAQSKLGQPDKISKEYTGTFYAYYKMGLEIWTDRKGYIKSIILKTKNDKYSPFRGYTSKGLILEGDVSPAKIYAIYGEPKTHINFFDDNWQQKVGKAKANLEPYIMNHKDIGFAIVYPKEHVKFYITKDIVTEITIPE